MRWRRTQTGGESSPQRELEDSLKEIKTLLAQAYAGFNAATDGELVESYIYEIQALQTRYSYLLRQRKALETAAVHAGSRSHPRRPVHDPLPVV